MSVVHPYETPLLGDYVLPVPVTDLQKKVYSAVISSNFSELLSFFDESKKSSDKYMPKIERMMKDLKIVSTHPYLLLKHMQPALAHKRAPQQLESASGKFQSLVTLCRRFTNPAQNVAIICDAGRLTDMVDVVLSDREMNVTRYSDKTNTKLYRKELGKRRGAMFHLVPSNFEDLVQAVYAAFDVIILMDNDMDITGTYGRGIRAQLRDPTIRAPLASVIRLVSLNSAQHIELLPSLNFTEQIATTVVLKDQAGALPPIVKNYYTRDLSPLQPFVNNPDGPYPLPALGTVKIASLQDVERALYLDDHDQYQVEFTNRGTKRRMKAESTDSGDDESSDEVKVTRIKSESSASPSPLSSLVAKPDPIRKLDLLDETELLLKEVAEHQGLTHNILIRFNDLLTENRLLRDEVSSHRRLAGTREFEVEHDRNSINILARQIQELEQRRLVDGRKLEKLRARNEKVESELTNKARWWEVLALKLQLCPTEASRTQELTTQLTEAESRNERLQQDLKNEVSRYARLESVSKVSSEYAERLTKEQEVLKAKNEELTAKLEVAPEAKLAQMEQQLKCRDLELNAMKADYENLKASVRTQLSRSPPVFSGRRGKRGGRGRGGRQNSPYLPVV